MKSNDQLTVILEVYARPGQLTEYDLPVIVNYQRPFWGVRTKQSQPSI